MLPPPITMPICAPIAAIAFTSVANPRSVSKSRPIPRSPARASPESLRRTRGYFRSLMRSTGSGLAHLEAHEALHRQRLARILRRLLHEVADRLLVVAYPRLPE